MYFSFNQGQLLQGKLTKPWTNCKFDEILPASYSEMAADMGFSIKQGE